MSDDELRAKVVGALAGVDATQINTLGAQIARELAGDQSSAMSFGGYQIFGDSPRLSPPELGRLHDIVWDLIIEGYLRPGLGDGQTNDLPFVHVTAKGRAYFKS